MGAPPADEASVSIPFPLFGKPEERETPEEADSLQKLIPCGRIGETTDVAPVALWLASRQADYITGTTIYVDGGMLLYPGFRTGG
jgi:glucose 1-dehydrogenase